MTTDSKDKVNRILDTLHYSTKAVTLNFEELVEFYNTTIKSEQEKFQKEKKEIFNEIGKFKCGTCYEQLQNLKQRLLK